MHVHNFCEAVIQIFNWTASDNIQLIIMLQLRHYSDNFQLTDYRNKIQIYENESRLLS